MLNKTGAWHRSLAIVALCGTGIFVGSTWHTATATTAMREVATPTSVAVLDLNRVLEGLAEYEEMAQRLGSQFEVSQRSIQDLTSRIQQVDLELEQIKDRNSQAYIDKALEGTLLRGNREHGMKVANQRFDLLRGEAMRVVYTKITKAAQRVGEAGGWDIILLDDRSLVQLADEGGLITGSRMNDFVINRRTLYAGPRADITDELITLMNNEFKAARR